MAKQAVKGKPVTITRKDVIAYMALTVRKRRVDQISRRLEKERGELKTKLTEWLKQNLEFGAEVLTKFHHHFRWKSLGQKVDWEAEWMKFYGDGAAEAAAKLQSKAATSYTLEVTPIL